MRFLLIIAFSLVASCLLVGGVAVLVVWVLDTLNDLRWRAVDKALERDFWKYPKRRRR